MFWLRNKKNNFQLHTLIWGPDKQISEWKTIVPNGKKRVTLVYFCFSEAFRGFPILRELEMPLNGLRSLHPKLEDYVNLEVTVFGINAPEKVTKTQENITHKRAKRSALSQQVTTRLQGTTNVKHK